MRKQLWVLFGAATLAASISGCRIDVVDECFDDLDCPSGYYCDAFGSCISETGGVRCDDGTGVCDPGFVCGTDGLCYGSSGCVQDSECMARELNSYCGPDGLCYRNVDCTSNPSVCGGGYYCGFDGNCYVDKACTTSEQCSAGFYCAWDGLCYAQYAGECQSNSECNVPGRNDYYCGIDGNCYRRVTGCTAATCGGGYACSPYDGGCYLKMPCTTNSCRPGWFCDATTLNCFPDNR